MEEAVDQTLQTAKENQKIVKKGKKWLEALYGALKEKHPKHYKHYEENEDVADYIDTQLVDTDDDHNNNFYRNRNGGEGKSPDVPFHEITSSYSYFEVI